MGIIPAYAGSTGPGVFDPPRGRDHPRIRGEHGVVIRRLSADVGSSPHTRGAQTRRPSPRKAARIIPAYAGSTRLPRRRRHVRTDHPRIRGEHFCPRECFAPGPGSSPHTRGALPGQLSGRHGYRIIPAYAGSTRIGNAARLIRTDHPRIRGEHTWKSLQYQGSPP